LARITEPGALGIAERSSARAHTAAETSNNAINVASTPLFIENSLLARKAENNVCYDARKERRIDFNQNKLVNIFNSRYSSEWC
jgi:hypothetical protein